MRKCENRQTNFFDCYISLIYMGVTRRVADFIFFVSYLCSVKPE